MTRRFPLLFTSFLALASATTLGPPSSELPVSPAIQLTPGPGPGLPSLSSVGFTSSDLYNLTSTDLSHLLVRSPSHIHQKRTAKCLHDSDFPNLHSAGAKSVLSCIIYLQFLGIAPCAVTVNGVNTFCYAKHPEDNCDARINGYATGVSAFVSPEGNEAMMVEVVDSGSEVVGEVV